ncbi:PAS domain-containing protein [Alishewanella sp. 16-MA]|uniref:histidine kinase n=1 Tax=Alishewanella maricola TaxID=2795740 RepID=A0ABS8C0L5_9ALTE|nr:PAS domain-containing protein [Alishewanella maricola]MCB5225866.1 PAS domain-containing protein [Alishewanella maricola]
MKSTHYLKEELYELIKTDESIFDFIQESSLDGLWYWDLERPEEEWMDPKFWAVLGYDYREMPHKASAWQDIIDPEDLKLATENFIKHSENPDHPYDQTVRYTHKNGSTVWIRCRGLAIRDNQGKPTRMLGAHQDITDVKNNELLLQMKTNQLRNALNVSKVGSWELDLKTNEVLWTEELYKMYGFDPSVAPPIYTEQMKMFTPESWDVLTSSIAIAKEQGIPYELELTTIRNDGSHGWMWARGEAVFDNQKNITGLRGVAQDITEKKKLELEKESLIKRLNYALDASGDGIWDWTPANGITVFSKAWVEMLGYKVGELASLASEWSDRLHPDDAEWVFAAINKVTQTPENGDTFSHEYRFRNKAGDYLWILNKAKVVERNEQGEASRVVGTHTNITEQIKSERALKDSELRLSLATKAGGVGVWDWDVVKNVLTWDEQMFALYGVTGDQFSNAYEAWYNGVYEADRERGNTEIELAIKGEKEFNTEFRVQHPNGDIRNIRAIATVVRDQEGNPLRMIGTNWDITKEKEALWQFKDAKKQAEAASKAKSEFLANMSHEIRTPMNAVLGMLQLMQSTELSMQQDDYTSKAQIAAKSLLNLINDILDYSKIEAGKLELEQHPFSTEALLQELAVVLSPSLGKKNVELLFDIDRNLPTTIEGDRLRLQQILINLASNAIKFTADGEVIIQLTQLQINNKKTRIRFSVRDTGIGISPSQQKRIFEGFTQAEASTTRQYGGTGLGLVISKRIIELMGGELQLQSTPGQGSCFWFDVEFGVTTTVDEDVYVARSIAIGPDTTVLIVDDNESALEILQKTVTQLGAHVLVARSGEEALACVEQCVNTKQRLHAVLMDYRMPGMNGLEVAQCIRAKSGASSLPVVIMVSAFGRDEIIKAQTTGVVPYAAFLTKPVTSVQLGVLLERSLSGETLAPSLRVQPKQSTSPLQGLHLLLVEDQEFNRIVASELLENEGAVIDVAVGGQEGVEAVTQGGTSYDVVLMDVQMPVVDGLEATRRIRADGRFTTLPIIAMTANVYASDQEDCIKAGMNGHLAKPFDLDKVIDTILFFTDKTRNKDSDLPILADNTESSSGNPAEDIALQPLQFQQKDLATLLKPFGGKEAFYRRLIQVFEANFASQLVSLQEKIEQNDHQEILALLHSMKGTTGTIGLSTLYQTICQLEIQCKQQLDQPTSSLNTFYSGLTERIDFIAQRELSDIHQLLAQQDELKAEVVLTPTTYSKDDIINMLSPLKPYLEESNLKALPLARQLKEKFVGHEQLLMQTSALFQAIEQLKFDDALLELSKLRA